MLPYKRVHSFPFKTFNIAQLGFFHQFLSHFSKNAYHFKNNSNFVLNTNSTTNSSCSHQFASPIFSTNFSQLEHLKRKEFFNHPKQFFSVCQLKKKL